MKEITYGETWTYGDLAKGGDAVPCAVGAACRANPIPVILSSYGVVTANGRTAGFPEKTA